MAEASATISASFPTPLLIIGVLAALFLIVFLADLAAFRFRTWNIARKMRRERKETERLSQKPLPSPPPLPQEFRRPSAEERKGQIIDKRFRLVRGEPEGDDAA